MTQVALIYPLLAIGLAVAFVGGVLLSFSDFIMRALAAANPTAGTESMQVINREVYRSVFMVLFIGLVPVTLLLSGYAISALQGSVLGHILFGTSFYIVGVFLVTGLGNVPMNTRLDSLALGGVEAQAYWPDYVLRWSKLNHVRTVASLMSAAVFLHAAMIAARTS